MSVRVHEEAGDATRSQPTLLAAAVDPELNPEACDVEHWLHSVPQRSLAGLVRGHAPATRVPAHMLEPGPLREACLQEFAFRATTEEMTARNLSHLVLHAPTRATMDFYATQLLDEARHADVFRWHLVELGIPRDGLDRAMADLVGRKRQTMLEPLERFALDVLGAGDFIAGVVFLTIIGEGALAPAAEMSERKWRVLDPPASEIAHGANLDELRHLGVGTAIVRDYLLARPDERERLSELIRRGAAFWAQLPVVDVLLEREALFQAGMAQQRELLGDYEIVPGRRLVDTSIEERMTLQGGWSAEMKQSRLAHMGLNA